MESRKLIGFGKNSFVISIPKSWITANNLKKGDTVFVDTLQDSINISFKSDEKKEVRTAFVDAKKNKSIKQIKTEIVSAYLNNYNVIEIKGDLKTSAKIIKEVIKDLAGMEIMELSSDRIIARDLLDEKNVSILNLIRRLDMSIRSMLDDAIASIDKDVNYYEDIFQRDQDINRMVFLAYRVMRNCLIDYKMSIELGLSNLDVLKYWLIIMRLEKIGDQCKRIARSLRYIDLNKKETEELKTIYTSIKSEYLQGMKSLYVNDIEAAYKVSIESSVYISQCNSFLEKKQDAVTMHVIENLKSMVSSIKHIARSVIGS